MTVKELRQRVLDAGGKVVEGSMIMTYEEGKDVDIHEDSELVCWVSSSADEDIKVEKAVTYHNEKILANIDSLAVFAQICGFVVGEVKPITIEQKSPVDEVEHHRMRGMLEAYEKIIIGRSITASK